MPKIKLLISPIISEIFSIKIKNNLFCGFAVVKRGDFSVLKASKAKALFDYVYLRKNGLSDKKAVEELRLNLDNFKAGDWREFKKYVVLGGSAKIKKIFKLLRQ